GRLLPDAGRAVIGEFDARGFERALQRLSRHPRHSFLRFEVAYDGNLDGSAGCEAIFAPVEKSAGGAALGGGHARYIAIRSAQRHSETAAPTFVCLALPQ